jgi:hypothetical protein
MLSTLIKIVDSPAPLWEKQALTIDARMRDDKKKVNGHGTSKTHEPSNATTKETL